MLPAWINIKLTLRFSSHAASSCLINGLVPHYPCNILSAIYPHDSSINFPHKASLKKSSSSSSYFPVQYHPLPPAAVRELCNGFVVQVYLCISVGDTSSARSLYRVSWIDRTGRCYSTFKPLLSIEIRVCLATTLMRLYGRGYYFLLFLFSFFFFFFSTNWFNFSNLLIFEGGISEFANVWISSLFLVYIYIIYIIYTSIITNVIIDVIHY